MKCSPDKHDWVPDPYRLLRLLNLITVIYFNDKRYMILNLEIFSLETFL